MHPAARSIIEPFLRARARGGLPSIVTALLEAPEPAAFYASIGDRCVAFASLWYENLSVERVARVAFWLTEAGDVAIRKWIDMNLVEQLVGHAKKNGATAVRARIDGEDEARRTALATTEFEATDELFRLERVLPRADQPPPLKFQVARVRLVDVFKLHNDAYAGDADGVRLTKQSAKTLEEPSSEIWLAKIDKVPVGFVEVGPAVAGGQGHIESVAVLASHRRQGIGAALVEWAMHRLVTRGARTVTLQVRGSNQPAMHLYKRMGFRPVQALAIWQRVLIKPPPLV